MASALSACGAVAQRPSWAPARAQQRGRGMRVAAQYTSEQLAFLERKKVESAGPAQAAAPAPAGGLSAEQAAFVQRKAAEQASAANGAANPVPYSQRKPIAQPGLVGSLAKQPPASPAPRPSFRPSSRQPTSSPAAAKWDHATRVMPAGAAAPVTPAGYNASLAQAPVAAPAGGLTPEQEAFMQRKAAEVRAPPPPTPLRGRSATPRPASRPSASAASPAAAKWDHATRVMPAGAAAPVTPAGYNTSLAQAPAAAADGLSAEQAAFVQRKAVEQASVGSGAANPVPYSQRKPIAQPGLVGSLAKQPPASPAPRPSFRPSSRQPTSSPAAAKWDHATRVMPAGAAAPVTPAGYNASLAQPPAAAADGLSAEQAAFVQRKAAEQASAAGDAANPVPYSQRKPIAQPGLVGSLAKQQPSVAPANPSPRPSFRPSSRQPTSSPAAAKWDHATRVMPAGSPPPVTPARYMHVTPEEAALLSKEQAEFLERKRAGGK